MLVVCVQARASVHLSARASTNDSKRDDAKRYPASSVCITMSAPPTFELRRATASDAAQLSELIGSTWSKFFAYSVSEADLATYLNTTVSEAQIRREIEDESKYCIVAYSTDASKSGSNGEEGGTETIIGVSMLDLKATETSLTTRNPVKLNRLYIRPEYQGGGLASALLHQSETACRDMGRDGMWLGVWEDNARAIRFYEKLGFERRGEHFFMLGESRRRDWTMEKAL